jgi:hypothetical protein
MSIQAPPVSPVSGSMLCYNSYYHTQGLRERELQLRTRPAGSGKSDKVNEIDGVGVRVSGVRVPTLSALCSAYFLQPGLDSGARVNSRGD